MKTIKYITMVLMSLTFLMISCENVLEENPPSNISISNFYTSGDDALAGLYGAYNSIYSFYGYTDIQYGEVNADNLTISPFVADLFEWDEFTYNTDITN